MAYAGSYPQGVHNAVVSAAPDGNLPGALDKLYAAVSGLTDPIKEMVDGAILVAPSLWEQLLSAIPGTKGEGTGRLAGRSVPPLRTDALALRIEIDDTVREWLNALPSSTPVGLRALAAARWRPQDTRDIDEIAARVESWAVAVQSLLNPTSTKTISAPCPACGATHAFRRDSAGERVRSPALQIETQIGCTCQVCRHTWGPELYLHLARVLGFETPPGVLE